jgi:hypothetical protein
MDASVPQNNPRSLLAEHLGSQEAAAQYRQCAEAAERWHTRMIGRSLWYQWDAERWAERREARKPAAAATVIPQAIVAYIHHELDALRAEMAQAILERR